VTNVSGQLISAASTYEASLPIGLLARRLAVVGLGVQVSRHRDTCQLTLLGAATGKSFLALDNSGHGRWYYKPAAGPASNPATLTTIITYLLRPPPRTTSQAAYQALPLKGQVGRSLQDRGLNVTLRVSEDLESFEATTDIDVTSPARPWLGTITLSDDAALDWHLDIQAAFHGNTTALIDVITPILRGR
jgi:hypothetical protein